jgi:hypothetical protein
MVQSVSSILGCLAMTRRIADVTEGCNHPIHCKCICVIVSSDLNPVSPATFLVIIIHLQWERCRATFDIFGKIGMERCQHIGCIV